MYLYIYCILGTEKALGGCLLAYLDLKYEIIVINQLIGTALVLTSNHNSVFLMYTKGLVQIVIGVSGMNKMYM